MSKSVQDPEAETRRASQALERYLECLQSDWRPRQPHQLTPDLAGAYQMAAFFRAASPDATTPTPVFVARLREQGQEGTSLAGTRSEGT